MTDFITGRLFIMCKMIRGVQKNSRLELLEPSSRYVVGEQEDEANNNVAGTGAGGENSTIPLHDFCFLRAR